MFIRKKLTSQEKNTLVDIIGDWKKDANVSDDVYFIFEKRILILVTDHPGNLIGKSGTLSDKYLKICKIRLPKIKKIKFYDFTNKV